MIKEIRPALVLLVLMTVLTGIVYPYAITGLAQLFFPGEANGSLVTVGGKVVGSALIGQDFASDRYFHGRPSATTDTDPKDPTKTIASPYNAQGSTGSNLGPTSKALVDRVKADAVALKPAPGEKIPVDLVTSSASGLDPDITPAAAFFQAGRIAAARHLPVEAVRRLIVGHIEGRALGFLGEPHVNVLVLNRGLDALSP